MTFRPCPKPAPRVKAPKAMKRVNKERSAKEWKRAFHSEGYCAWVRSLGCSVPTCRNEDIEVSHARSRGAGGDWRETLPLCHDHHALSHTIGVKSFEKRVGFTLESVAAAVHQRWRQFAGITDED